MASARMSRLLVSDRSGSEFVIDADIGRSVMEIIRDAGVDELLALCGGCCSCATCHIYIDPVSVQGLPEMTEDENDLLDSSSHRQMNSRLACQIIFNETIDGLKVQIAPED